MNRILVLPKYIPLNTYFKTISDGMDHVGWRVTDFSYLLCLEGNYDVLHVHFPTFIFNNRKRWISFGRLGIFTSLLLLNKARGKKVVWTVHNLAHHEAFHPKVEARFMSWFTSVVDMSIHLSESGRAVAFDKFPKLRDHKSVVIPHPYYGESKFKSPDLSRVEAAKILGLPLNIPIILFFGQIRTYKNVIELIKCFRHRNTRDACLVIAGVPFKNYLKEEILLAAGGDQRVELMLYYIPETQLRLLLTAASLVVLPYRDILNSGAAMLSLTHNRPVLVPDRGAMSELQNNIGKDWVKVYEPPLTPEILESALSWTVVSQNKEPNLDMFAPVRVIEAHDKAFIDMQGGYTGG